MQEIRDKLGMPNAVVKVEEGINISSANFKTNIHVPCLKTYRFIRIYNTRSNRWSQLFICDYHHCGKQFKKWHNLFDHLRIHSKERPFKCTVLHCNHAYS